MKILPNFSIFYGEDQNLLDSQISLDFATETVEFFRKWISKRSKEVRKKLELEEDPF